MRVSIRPSAVRFMTTYSVPVQFPTIPSSKELLAIDHGTRLHLTIQSYYQPHFADVVLLTQRKNYFLDVGSGRMVSNTIVL